MTLRRIAQDAGLVETAKWGHPVYVHDGRNIAMIGAFHALTPGRRNSWVLHVQGAKAPATRLARVEKARPRILAGKGALER